MNFDIFDLSKNNVGTIDINEDVFGVRPRELNRDNIISRVIVWQRLRRMSGTHKVKNVAEVAGSTKKPFKQKGTGNARQGNIRAVQLRGGGVAHGPVFRSHANKLPKNIRRLGMIYALSYKISLGNVFVLDDLKMDSISTSKLSNLLNNFCTKRKLIITDSDIDTNDNFVKSVANIKNVSYISSAVGANVYDIIRNHTIIISKNCIESLEKRLSK